MRIAIVGAGLAGAFLARELGRAGARVTLFEKSNRIAAGASGNFAGSFRPLLTRKPTQQSRLVLLSFHELLRTLEELRSCGRAVEGLWGGRGVLQVARSHDEAVRLEQAWNERTDLHPEGEWIPAGTRLLGWDVTWGGVRFFRGGWLSPRSLCEQALAEAPGVEIRINEELPLNPRSALSQLDPFDSVVYCASHACRALPDFQNRITTQVIRGQISEIPWPSERTPEVPILFKEYLIPVAEGRLVVGATHDRDNASEIALPEDHARLLERLRGSIPAELLEALSRVPPSRLRAGVRFTTPSHLPRVGPIRETSKELGKPAYCLTALGSRGILYAPILARSLASRILDRSDDPLPEDLRQALGCES